MLQNNAQLKSLIDKLWQNFWEGGLVDWVWMSGKAGINIPQRVLGVKIDGLVGDKTMQVHLPAGIVHYNSTRNFGQQCS